MYTQSELTKKPQNDSGCCVSCSAPSCFMAFDGTLCAHTRVCCQVFWSCTTISTCPIPPRKQGPKANLKDVVAKPKTGQVLCKMIWYTGSSHPQAPSSNNEMDMVMALMWGVSSMIQWSRVFRVCTYRPHLSESYRNHLKEINPSTTSRRKSEEINSTSLKNNRPVRGETAMDPENEEDGLQSSVSGKYSNLWKGGCPSFSRDTWQLLRESIPTTWEKTIVGCVNCPDLSSNKLLKLGTEETSGDIDFHHAFIFFLSCKMILLNNLLFLILSIIKQSR